MNMAKVLFQFVRNILNMSRAFSADAGADLGWVKDPPTMDLPKQDEAMAQLNACDTYLFS